MVIESIHNSKKYECLHPLFVKAFEFIRGNDLQNMVPGDYIIEEAVLKAIIYDGPGKTKEVSLEKFECHNHFIDIQYIINGNESMGWKSRHSCILPKGEYSEEKDVLFFNDQPDMFFTLRPGQFAIFFPEDVHAPLISEGEVKKLIITVTV
ncbi:MAG TPA: YhcH/YjgK/YiaL family protein [Niabella sp.]|nr:YhcH/YjgK/YiaL family protein [Niabella sp.]